MSPTGIPTTRRPRRAGTVRAGPLPHALSGALAVAATISAAVSLGVPSVLTGAAVGNGNLRGTALIVLMLGIPVLLTAMLRTSRGSARATIVWLGTLGYLLYQAVLFCFASPINALFLPYVAYLASGCGASSRSSRRSTGLRSRSGSHPARRSAPSPPSHS